MSTDFWEQHLKEEQERKDQNKKKMREHMQDIITWCDEKVANGEELTMEWDGGNDSGCFYLKLDDQDITPDYSDTESIPAMLMSMCEDEADYGSFAGDYYTIGKLIYNAETKTFEGVDDFSTNDSAVITDFNLEVKIPETFWFDSLALTINLSGSAEIDQINASLVLDNGPTSDMHETWETQAVKDIEEHINKFFNDGKLDPDTVDGAYNDIFIDKEDMTLENGMYICKVDSIEYSLRTSEEKDISICLTDYID